MERDSAPTGGAYGRETGPEGPVSQAPIRTSGSLRLRLVLGLLRLLALLPVGHPALTRVLGDELLGVLARLRVGPLVVRRLHQVARGAVQLAGDAVVQRQLHDPDGVDDDAGGVGRVPDLELELEVEGYVAEGLALDADVRPLAVGQPWHVVRRADVDV